MWMQVVTSGWLFQNSGSAPAHLGCRSHFSCREGDWVWQSVAPWPLAKSSVRSDSVTWRWAVHGESSKGGKGCARSEGEESPQHQVGQSHAPPASWVVVTCFLVQWLLWAHAHISTYAFFFSLYPMASKIHYSNSFSARSSQQYCPSVIFPLSLLRSKLNPYTQTTPCRFLFCPFFNQISWTFCTEF